MFLQKTKKMIQFCLQAVKLKLKRNKRLLFMDLLIGLFREAKTIFTMIFPAVIIQLVLDRTKIDIILLIVCGICAGLTVFSIGIELLQRSLQNDSIKALNYIILNLNEKVMHIDLEDAEQNEVYEAYDKAYDSIWNFSEVDYVLFSTIFSKTLSLFITLYIFGTIHWGIALFAFSTLLFEFILNMMMDQKLHKKDQELSALNHKKRYISDTIFDFKTNREIYINQSEHFFLNKYKGVLDNSLKLEGEKKDISVSYNYIYEFMEVVRTCMIYGFGIVQYTRGLLPIANFTLFSNAAKQMTYAIWQIMKGFSELFRITNYFEDYESYMTIHESMRTSGKEKIEESKVKIEFRHVSYRYPNQKEDAIHDVSFFINEGETAAIVGDNGAGKSTIVKLLMRLYRPTEGIILLNGRNIEEYEYEEYLTEFSPVFQDFMLYAFTISENIIFDRELKKSEIYTILQKVGLKQKITSLPKGLDTPYTKRFYEDGVEFSGGEEQKLVIARAMAKKGNLLILDEPTSALDPLAEHELYEMIHSIGEIGTTVYISHRLGTTRFSDKILVFDQGKLVQTGTHEELLQCNGTYQNIFNMQASLYREKKEYIPFH